jgi:hypothetical protein
MEVLLGRFILIIGVYCFFNGAAPVFGIPPSHNLLTTSMGLADDAFFSLIFGGFLVWFGFHLSEADPFKPLPRPEPKNYFFLRDDHPVRKPVIRCVKACANCFARLVVRH